MSNVRDTNLLARGGAEGLAYVQTTAQKALALGGALTPEGMDYLHALDRDYTRRNLSPARCGGDRPARPGIYTGKPLAGRLRRPAGRRHLPPPPAHSL